MAALTVWLPGAHAAFVVDETIRQPCPVCQRATAIFVVRLIGTRQIATCLACDRTAPEAR